MRAQVGEDTIGTVQCNAVQYSAVYVYANVWEAPLNTQSLQGLGAHPNEVVWTKLRTGL